MLTQSHPEIAEKLMKEAQKEIELRYRQYEELANSKIYEMFFNAHNGNGQSE